MFAVKFIKGVEVSELYDLLGERVRQKLNMAHQLGPALRRLSQYHDHRFSEPLVPAGCLGSPRSNPGLRSLTYQNPAVIVAVLPEDFSAGKEIGLSPKTK